ncbi:MAG TPA: hypothetical protein DIS79_11100 [Bacteroidetes bacterium]|nr:hypothetical protein [Bacteroidota bacterium]
MSNSSVLSLNRMSFANDLRFDLGGVGSGSFAGSAGGGGGGGGAGVSTGGAGVSAGGGATSPSSQGSMSLLRRVFAPCSPLCQVPLFFGHGSIGSITPSPSVSGLFGSVPQSAEISSPSSNPSRSVSGTRGFVK